MGSGPSPEKSQKYRVSWRYWSGSPEKKTQSYQASIQGWAIIGTPVKRHHRHASETPFKWKGVSLAGR